MYINGRRHVCYSECNVVSDECGEPTPCLLQPVAAHGGKVLYCWSVCLRSELGFLNYDDISMCIVNKQFEPLELVFDSVYVLTCCTMMIFLSFLLLGLW